MKKLLLTLLLLMLPVISLCETPDTLITPRDRSLEPLLAQMPDADASRWHDVTPPALDGMDWRIYKHRETFEALLLTADGQVAGAVKPSKNETTDNARARSAKLRVFEKKQEAE